MEKVKAVVIGAGCGGLSAAITLKKNGIDDVLVIEKDAEAGGILEQCIHNGFGLETFREQLSGPSYAERFIREAEKLDVRILLNTMVTSITKDRIIEYVNESGVHHVAADAVILAVGCYERPRGAVNIMGDRCSGVYTAGQAQRYLNMDGYLVGRRVFILGSGDIGLIMARRMTLEGAEVLGVAEIMPYSNGLPRNIKQCLEDFNIPLYLSHTVTRTFGRDRLERIEVMEVDENRNPVAGSEKYFDADVLLLSVGLIPENHLAEHAGIEISPATKGPVVDDRYMTSAEGIFACGNGLHVHDLADFVVLQAKQAAEGAAEYLKNPSSRGAAVKIRNGKNVSYCVPSYVHPADPEGNVEFFYRVRKPLDHAVLKISSGTAVLRTIKKQKMLPSVMEKAVLTKKEIASAEEDFIIEIEEAAE